MHVYTVENIVEQLTGIVYNIYCYITIVVLYIDDQSDNLI